MALFSTTKASKISLILFTFFVSLATLHVSCFQFEVGGERGWVKPDGNKVETYNEWAEQHRFHIGDTINFRYTNDSMLVVERDDYDNCEVSNPISKFDDGNTVFEFDRSGFFYFISGELGNCQAGQKMIIRVMEQPAAHHPTASISEPPAEGPSGFHGGGIITDSKGPTAVNSTDMLSVASCVMTFFMGVVIVLYLFMD